MLGRTQCDPRTISFALFMQGLAEFERGDHVRAAARSNEARAAAGPGEELLIQHSGPLLILANVAVSRGDYEAAQRLYDEAIEVNRRTGEAWSLGILLSASAGLRIVRENCSRRTSRQRRPCRSVRNWKTHAASPGVWTSSPACSPPADSVARRHAHGARRIACSKAWAAPFHKRSGGSGAGTSRRHGSHSAARASMPPARRAGSCHCGKPSHARARKRISPSRMGRLFQQRWSRGDEDRHEDLRGRARRIRHQAHRSRP